MIIAVDAGNKQIKTENFVFHSGIQESESRPQTCEEALLYKGKYYVPSSRRIKYLRDKTEDERFYILTLMAVAKEIDFAMQEGINRYSPNVTIQVDLLVDLPPAHYAGLYEKFEQYFYRDGSMVSFAYREKEYTIHFRSVTAYPQAYMAFLWINHTQKMMRLPKVLVIDIGGFTSDYLLIRQGNPDLEFCDSLEKGVILFYNSVIAQIRQKYNILLDEADIDTIICEKESYCKEVVQNEVRDIAEKYVVEFLGEFRELGIDFATCFTVFTGGGAVLFQRILDKVFVKFDGRYYLEMDIHANAKGCRIQYLAEIA